MHGCKGIFFLSLILVFVAGTIHSQDFDEDSLIVSEKMLIDAVSSESSNTSEESSASTGTLMRGESSLETEIEEEMAVTGEPETAPEASEAETTEIPVTGVEDLVAEEVPDEPAARIAEEAVLPAETTAEEEPVATVEQPPSEATFAMPDDMLGEVQEPAAEDVVEEKGVPQTEAPVPTVTAAEPVTTTTKETAATPPEAAEEEAASEPVVEDLVFEIPSMDEPTEKTADEGSPESAVAAEEPEEAATTEADTVASEPEVEEIPVAEAEPVETTPLVAEAAPAAPEEESTPAAVSEPTAPPPEEAVAAEAPKEAVPMTETAEPATVEERVEPSPAQKERMETLAVLKGMDEQEELRRKAMEAHGLDRLAAGVDAMKQGRYQQAVRSLEQAIEHLGVRPQSKRQKERAQKALAETYYRWAFSLRKRDQLEDAEAKARQAATLGYRRADELVADIQKQLETPEEPKKKALPAPWEEESFVNKEEEVAARLKRGRQLLLVSDYDEAQRMFESVLSVDPKNTEALRLMQKVLDKQYDMASIEFDTTRKHMMAELRKTWNRRDYALTEEERRRIEDLTREVTKSTTEQERLAIVDKMKRIVIPHIEFRQANINDVIDFLHEQSKEFDVPPEDADPQTYRRGVNIILNLQSKGEEERPSGEFNAFAVPDEGQSMGEGPGQVPITFSATYISLEEALNIVAQVADLKYRVEGSVVMVVPRDAPIGPIVHQMYDVLPSVGEKIAQVGPELESGRGGDFLSGRDSGVGQSRGDWKQFFGEMGVEWPAGSQIKYIPAIGKIMVANTADNLAVFEQRLAALNVVPYQIEIEARFVEVQQTDLDSLGFEWLLTDDWELAQEKAGNVPMAAKKRIQIAANSPDGFTIGNRFSDTITLSGGGTVADDVLRVAGVLTNPELAFVLHMLEQKGNADLLSAPKITTQSGSEATIRVVTEYIYPTDYEIVSGDEFSVSGTDGATGGGGITAPVVEPGGFETREVGVILSVLPEVSTGGQMINLTMSPEVVSEPDWEDYGMDVSLLTSFGGETTTHLPIRQPFFHTRRLTTSIAIYNGATVVMGGMINETRVEVDDKIPFFGDIPLIGRLFRSSYERSEKRNLLIFVTAKLVDPAGRPLKSSSAESFAQQSE